MSNIIQIGEFYDVTIVNGQEIIDPTGRRMSVSEIRSAVDSTIPILLNMAEDLVASATPQTANSVRMAVASLGSVSDKLSAASQALAAMGIRSQRVDLLNKWRSMTDDEQADYASAADFVKENLVV